MRRFGAVSLLLWGLGLAMGGNSSRAAVQTANIQVSGTTNPFTISYVLAQQAVTMQVKIFPVGNATPIRTISIDDATATGPMGPGTHGTASGNLPPITWDGNNDGGQPAPGGSYYVQIHTTGAAVTTLTNLVAISAPTSSGWRAFKGDSLDTPPRVEARNVYGGGSNTDPASPFHNMVYYGAAKTNANNNGSGGADAVYPDASSIFVSLLTDRGAEGSYDYCSADVESDGSLLLGGQGSKYLVNVNPVSGATIAKYGAGVIDVRELHVFGSGATARVYFVNDTTATDKTGTTLTGGIGFLSPINNTTADATTGLIYTMIVPSSAMPTVNVYGLAVNHTETSLWVCGYSATNSGLFIYRFDKQGDGTWQANTTFNSGSATYISSLTSPGRLRGLALSPDEKVLWVGSPNAVTLTSNKLFGIDSTTGLGPQSAGGVDLTAAYQLFTYASDSAYFTPQGMVTTARDQTHAAGTPYNVYASGYDSIAASTSANAVSVFAPPDNGSDDTTISAPFTSTAASQVSILTGPTVSGITGNSATITWTTDLVSSTLVHYGGAASSYTSPDVTVPGTTTTHSVTLANLVPGATYYFQVESDLSPLSPATANGQFSTLPDITLVSESLVAAQTSANLTFVTNVASGGVAHWGDNPTTFNQTDITVPSGTSHSITFPALTAGKTYYYQLALTGTNAGALTTLTSVFATAAPGGTAGTVTDNAFALAHGVDLVGASAVSLPAQGIPGLSSAAGVDLPVAMYGHGVVAYNGYLYAIGGADSTDTATSGIYFIKINSDGSLDSTLGWQSAANPLPVNRKEISNACFAYNGKLYVVGGDDETGAATTSVLYAPINATTGDLGTWLGIDTTQSPPVVTNPMPAARTRGSACVADGSLLVSGGAGGGVNSTNYVAQIRPDGSIGTWQTAGPLNGSRWKHDTLVNDHHAYSIGGDNSAGAHVSQVSIGTVQPDGTLSAFYPADYYPTHGTSQTDVPHYAMAADVLGGKIVTAGGANLSGVSGQDNARAVISYSTLGSDDVTGPWAASSDVLPVGVEDVDGAVYNGNFYVVGGRTLGVQGDSTDTPSETGQTQVTIITTTADTSGSAYAYAGTLESKVIDLGSVNNLSHLKVNSSGTGSVEVRYRYANADGVFTDWFTAASQDADITGGARWFQYELVLHGDGTATPTVSSVTVSTASAVQPLSRADVVTALQIAGGLYTATSADKSRLAILGDSGVSVRDAIAIWRQLNGR